MSRERQTTPIVTPMSDSAELSGFGTQKRVFVRFGSSPIQQSYETILSLVILGIFLKPDSVTQSLTAAVDTLVNEAEDQFLDSLTDNDYKRLVESSNKIASVIGENENNFLAPLMDFIDNLIKKHKEKIGMTDLPEPQNKEEPEGAWEALLRLGPRGLEAAYGEDEYDYTVESGESEGAWEALLRLGPRGLETAYGEDEYDYTVELGGKS